MPLEPYQQWLVRGDNATDPFDALANYWRGFNGLYFPFEGSNEREKIKAFIQAAIPEDRASYLINNNLAPIDRLLSEPIIDMRGTGRNTAENIDEFHRRVTYLDKLKEVCMVAYQVRCNAEHGQKLPIDERDRYLCKAASILLADILRNYIPS